MKTCDGEDELKVGTRVYVSGKQDGREFTFNSGEIGHVHSYGDYVRIRFDDWTEGHGFEGREWCFYECNRKDWTITLRDPPASIGPSTYLNGHEADITFTPPAGDDQPTRPRFMTAWLVSDDCVFVPTGTAYMTKADADAHALEVLAENGCDDQIAVLELRAVHMARLTITSEAA